MQEALHTIADFAFECGAQLDLMTVGYATHGSLNARKENAILVTHGQAPCQWRAAGNPPLANRSRRSPRWPANHVAICIETSAVLNQLIS